jgi:dipeptidyl aminopeptidase/acylaminoacyl peptidase
MSAQNEQIRTMPADRLIFNGLDIIDYQKLMAEIAKGTLWAKACEILGDEAAQYASKSLSEKHYLTARQFFLNATAAYRVGQYTIIPDNKDKIGMYRKLINCYSEAAKLYAPEIVRVEVPYYGYKMIGWLRLPNDYNKNCPVVVSIGGADGWREEHHNYSNYYAERGIAYLMIDGPGQGETRLFNKVYMPIDIEKPLGAIIDYIYEDDRVGKNVGLVGYSFGGYLGARTASYNKKIKACCVIGGSYEPKEILNFLPNFINIFMALTGKEDEETRKMLKLMNLKESSPYISCSLMIIHGKLDPLFSVSGAQRLYDEASSKDKTIKIWEDGNHCITNHSTEVTTTIADWFIDKLNE